MNITFLQKRVVYLLWLLIVPAAFYIAYKFFPSDNYDYFNLSINLIILIAIMMLSITVHNVSITLERWVVFAVFFQYGIIAEMIFMQIAMIVLLYSEKSSTPKLFRYAFNSIIFVLISLISASVYHVMGGSFQMDLATFVGAGFIYASIYSLVNSLLIGVFFKFLGQDTSSMKKVLIWDYVTTIVLLPFALVFCILLNHFGNLAFLLVGIPFVLVLIVARNYMKSDQLNDMLASTSEIGHQLADRIGVTDVLDTFVDKIKGVIQYESAYIIDLRTGGRLVMLSFKEGEFQSKETNRIIFPQKKSQNDGLDMDSTKMFLNKKQLSSLKGFEFAPSVESVITSPVKRNQKTEGFLILTSNQKYAFRDMQAQIVELLTGYLAVAVEKARYYENTVEKSIRCGLTHLHNYRYLEAQLEEEMIRYHTGEISTLSAIILDIDHFKAINDTYGHQSGNDLLCAIAELLRGYQTIGATLARYGGEEFVMLLPDFSKQEATDLAEKIRKEVEASSFKIIPDLSIEREPQIVNMTISGGVATIPDDTKGGKELLRNADRALYIGGKQAGRNRVGVYGEESNLNIVV